MPAVFGANGFFVISLLVFVTILLLLEAGYLWWQARHGLQARKLRDRLFAVRSPEDGAAISQLLRQSGISENANLEQRLMRLPHVHGVARWLLQSGTNLTVTGLAAWVGFAAAAGWIAAGPGLHQTFLICAAFAATGAAMPLAWVAHRRTKRLRKIEEQLPDALDLMARALRAGHAFTAALKMAGEEFSQPIAGELRTVHDEVNFGVSMAQALEHLGERVPLTDLRYFIVAVLIQRESGGNLTDVLGNLSSLVRERLKLEARVRVLSSEGRMSAWILGLLPFALGFGMWLVNPKFMEPLWNDPIGITIMKYTLGLMAVGALIMRKIIHIRI
jgi:tight adherence protein B